MNDYLIVFLMGLFGVLHCIGMCGGLVMACNMKFGGGFSFAILYNTGRIVTYSLLGLMMGLLGRSLIATGLFDEFKGVVPIVAGLFMIIIGLDLLGLMPPSLKRLTAGLFPKALSNSLIGGHIKRKRPSAFVLGIFNGLMPCGFIYAVGIKAASTADPLKGMLIMASLGAGTFLPMLLAGSLAGLMDKRRFNMLSTVSSVLIIALGAKSILYGAGFQHILMPMHSM